MFGHSRRNTQILGLIWLDLGSWEDKLDGMSQRLVRMPVASKPKLLDQVRDVIRRKHYSIRTEQAYVDWIKRFIIYDGKRHPDRKTPNAQRPTPNVEYSEVNRSDR